MLKIIVDDPSNLSSFIESPMDLLSLLFTSLNSSQDSIRLDSVDFLLKYLKYLFDYNGILPFNSHQQVVYTFPDDASYASNEKNPSVIEKMHINLSSIVEETPSFDFVRKNSEEFGGLTFFEDSIISSPSFDMKKNTYKNKENKEIVLERIKLDCEDIYLGEDTWYLILFHLKEKVKDAHTKVRESSLEAFFTLLINFGYTFKSEFWALINKEIFSSLFEELLKGFLSSSTPLENNSLRYILNRSFNNYTKLISSYLAEYTGFLMDFLNTVKSFCETKNEFLAKLALSSFRNVLFKSFRKFSKESWEMIVKFLASLLEESTPRNLMEKENLEMAYPVNANKLGKSSESYEAIFRPINLRFNVKDCLTKCMIQLISLNITRELVERHVCFLPVEVFILIV